MKRKLQIAFGLFLGVFLIWFLFKDTNWANVRVAVASANWGWLTVAFVAVLLTFFTRSQRWGYIVRTAKPVPFRTLFNATQIGFLANFTLPLRAGEVIRAMVLARREGIPFTKCMAFVALDRVTDFFGLLFVLMITIVFFHPEGRIVLPPGMAFPESVQSVLEPENIRRGAELVGVLLVALVGALVVLYLNQPLALRVCGAVVGVVSKKLAERVNEMLSHFAAGLHVFRSGRDMALSLMWSLITWMLAAVCYHALVLAFHLSVPWYASFLMLAVLSIAISLPGAPGFVGQFQVGIMLPLAMLVPGVSLDTASAVAILGHLVNVLAVAIVGIYALRAEQIGLIELKHESEAAAAETDAGQ